jgi:hypothetical protein
MIINDTGILINNNLIRQDEKADNQNHSISDNITWAYF